MHQPESLVFRVFKACYFPMTNFLEARVNANSSYVWKSITASWGVIQKGVRWQVGNGRNIHIWQDNWVLREHYFRILSLLPAYWSVDATVDGLFWNGSNFWDVQLLDELFSSEEVELIRSIPLSLRYVED